MRQQIVAANWKMNASKQMANSLLTDIVPALTGSKTQVVICPPLPYLALLENSICNSTIKAGAQNVNANEQGAFTGEVAINMVKDFGVDYVIVGHSERRALYNEDNATVASKTRAVIEAGLSAILCVGETLSERQNNQAEAVIDDQLNAVIDTVGIDAFANIIIAYEPVWAIGTGKTATTEQAQAMHAFIRNKVAEKK